MTKRNKRTDPKEGMITAISFGIVLILLGIIYVSSLPNNLFDSFWTFANNFQIRQIPGMAISLFAPSSPSAHWVLYDAVFKLCLGISALQVIILAIRLAIQSPIDKIAETIGNLIYWPGSSYLVITYLNSSTNLSRWFQFWAALLIVGGLSLIARGSILFARRK